MPGTGTRARPRTRTQQLVDSLDVFAYDRLPAPVVRQAKNALYDCLGALLAATSRRYPVMELLEKTAAEAGPGTSRLFGSPLRTNAATAALANGTLAYYCDIESHHPSANVHAIAVVAPAALAVAERQRSSGADVLAATVAGIDVAARVSYALGPAVQYARGFHPTTVAGTFGSAVAAGLLLGLDGERFAEALGLAGTSASGLLSWVDDPTEQSRPLNIGLAAQAGVQAATLAALGMRGPADVFGGKYPFGLAFTGQWDQEALLAGIGERYAVGELFFKRNSCCVFIPAALDGLLDVMRTHDLRPADVESVAVRAPRSSYHVVDANPLRSHCMQYVLAVAAHRGRVGFADIMTDLRLTDPGIAALGDRVTVTGDAALDERAGALRQSVASVTEVTARTGETYVRDVEHPLGAAENPLSEADLERKFTALTADVLDGERARGIKAAVDGLDGAADVAALTSLLEAGTVSRVR
ncbi:MmgE/PrpD family protein [Streptomyces phytophilus]|uniref:MmgE/PrpD family protein n=1 Tax=Streptomyces phytophilus TaxID=722715 RepID=UPI0015F00B31|nr:MmgE/PrpD family protein [Streptomyces phytophilus]